MNDGADGLPEEDEELPELPATRLPTIDDEEPPAQVDYPDWSAEATKVVSGPVGQFKFPGTPFRSVAEARRHWVERAGQVIEDLSVPGRWIFRVRRYT